MRTLPDELMAPGISPARFTALYADILRRERPELVALVEAPLVVRVEVGPGMEHRWYLTHVWYEFMRAHPDRKKAVLNYYMDNAQLMMTESGPAQAPTGPETVDAVVPLIKSGGHVRVIEDDVRGRSLLTVPLAADMHIVYARDVGSGYQFLYAHNLDEMGITLDRLQVVSLDNLRRDLGVVNRYGGRDIRTLTVSGGLGSSVILLSEQVEAMEREVSGALVAGIPSRERVVYTGSGLSKGMREIAGAVRYRYLESTYEVSSALIIYRGGRWEAYRGVRG
jgi:uncharacterized protein YtpQ (UPF0354 family)